MAERPRPDYIKFSTYIGTVHSRTRDAAGRKRSDYSEFTTNVGTVYSPYVTGYLQQELRNNNLNFKMTAHETTSMKKKLKNKRQAKEKKI